MKNKTGDILIALLLTGLTALGIYGVLGNYTFVLFNSIEIPELIFDICGIVVSAIVGYSAVIMWINIFRKTEK
ncbi:MAG: hypothetical protein IJE40_00015 [Clostridia bacterium]|nr:hypothetical protein [Clostridia bacterium]